MPFLLAFVVIALGVHIYLLGIITTMILYMPLLFDGNMTTGEHARMCLTWPRILYKKIFYGE